MTDYFDEEVFRQDIMEANDCGEPVCVVLYHDENGKRLLQSVEWVNDIDCPAISAREEPVPPVQDRNSTYEIYQIPATEDSADYLFRPYEQAKEQLSAKDYARVYATIAPLHRPCARCRSVMWSWCAAGRARRHSMWTASTFRKCRSLSRCWTG